MRFAKAICVGWLVAAVPSWPAHSDDVDDSLKLYAVHIIRFPQKPFTGSGVYLGSGAIITAAHVAGLSLWTALQVYIAGQILPAAIIKRGQFHNVDLTLLSVDEQHLPVSLRLRRMTVCKNSPWAEEGVIVATPEGVARSRVVPP